MELTIIVVVLIRSFNNQLVGNMKYISKIFLVTSLFLSSAASAETNVGQVGVDKLTKALAASMPNVRPSKISSTPIQGLYEVIVGTLVVFMCYDARFMIEGDLYDLKSKENYSENAKSGIRLAAMKLTLPPLRQRGEDILMLFQNFAEQFSLEYGCEAPEVSAQEAAQLLQAPWPGNIRQLINIAERAVLQSRRGTGTIASVWMADNEES